MSVLNNIPVRIKYYLTEWKNDHPKCYALMYGDLRLNELSKKQLHDLLLHVTQQDLAVVSVEVNRLELYQ